MTFTQALGQVLDTLPEVDRTLLALQLDWDLTLREASYVLAQPVEAVAQRQYDLVRTVLKRLGPVLNEMIERQSASAMRLEHEAREASNHAVARTRVRQSAPE